MAGKTVLILGGGVGGLVAANELRRKLHREHRIVLVDRKTQHVFAPSFLWLMLGWRDPSRISQDLSLLKRKGIKYVNAEVLEIDLGKRLVKTSDQDLSYDYLIVALGAELHPKAIPGLSEAGYNLYCLKGVITLRDALKEFSGGTAAVVVSALPFKCPAAPYEAALLLDYAFRRRGIRDRVDLKIFTPEPLPMPVAGPIVGGAVKQMVEARGIGFHPQWKLISVDPEKREITFENGQKARFDLLIAIPPHRSPEVVQKAGLTDGTGWIPVDKGTLKTQHENVYALGDVTAIRLPGRYKPDVPLMLPKAGVFAHYQAEAVAQNIVAEIQGRTPPVAFDGKGW